MLRTRRAVSPGVFSIQGTASQKSSTDYLQMLMQMAAEHVKLLQNKECDWTVASQVFKHAEEDDHQWLSIVTALTGLRTGLFSHVFINCFVQYWLPVPPASPQLIVSLTEQLVDALMSETCDHARLNACLIFHALAFKYVGQISEQLLSERALDCLLKCLEETTRPALQLYALIALEAFARSALNKKRIIDRGIREQIYEILNDTEQRLMQGGEMHSTRNPTDQIRSIPMAKFRSDSTLSVDRSGSLCAFGSVPLAPVAAVRQGSLGILSLPSLPLFATGTQKRKYSLRTLLQRISRATLGTAHEDLASECCSSCTDDGTTDERAVSRQLEQLRFCCSWVMENSFFESDVWLAPPMDTSHVRATIDHTESGRHVKISPDGLEVRNDTHEFESVRATMGVSTGCWYYEATVYGPFCFQIGWTQSTVRYFANGDGVGDDDVSVGFDPVRQLLWCNRNGDKTVPAISTDGFKPGDTVGFFLDLYENAPYGRYIFSVNGEEIVSIHTTRPVSANTKYYPAASFNYQHIRFNFGAMPFKNPPPPHYSNFNNCCSIPTGLMPIPSGRTRHEEHLRILQSLPKSPQLDNVSTNSDAQECQICFDGPINVTLLPCTHSNMCMTCVMQCTDCPMCRVPIEARIEMEEVAKIRGARGVQMTRMPAIAKAAEADGES